MTEFKKGDIVVSENRVCMIVEATAYKLMRANTVTCSTAEASKIRLASHAERVSFVAKVKMNIKKHKDDLDEMCSLLDAYRREDLDNEQDD